MRSGPSTPTSSTGRSTPDNPLNYGMVSPDDNAPGGAGTSGIAGGIGQMPDGHDGYATVLRRRRTTSRPHSAKAESLGGSRLMGPETVMEGLTIGLFADPEGHVVGLAAQG